MKRLAVVALAALACSSVPPMGEQPSVTVTIPRGATLGAAIDSLAAAGVIAHPFGFSLYSRLRGLRGGLKSGTYAFPLHDDWSDVVDALKRGRGVLVRWPVPEGLMLWEIAERARINLGVPRDSFLAAARDPELLDELDIRGRAETLEGFLYPTTYLVRAHISAHDLVRTMVREFTAHWRPEWDARVDSLRFTRSEIVTLASIVQAEVRYGPDRPFVSAVYHNRLRLGMRLEADPTVIYAYGRRLHRVWEKNLRVASAYNTYLHTGLPPGPICSPDSASIAAALYPAPYPFLYFVAQPDGKHVFSATYEDHLAAIRRIKQAPRRAPTR
ncbi:MAG TPA: endolytic transglycosylase MltG [Gemmatimonadales bacterium]|nr:endolytic transglycosylase MltG [Gemmatimonadales bacterium]